MDHSLPDVPPLEGLLAVLAAAESGSLTLAAESLGVTHGAISRRVANVERWLGTAVFERHGRGVRLTPAGRRFARQIQHSLAALEQTAERWRPRQGRATVKLSVVPSFAKLWLLPVLSILLERLPEVRVDLVIEHRTADLEGGEADVAIRYGRGEWPGLEVRHLFAERLLPVGSPAFVERLGKQPSLETLAAAALIHDSDTSQWRAWFAEAGLRYRPRMGDRKFEDYDLVLAAAEGSLGLALLRLPLAQAWLESNKLVVVNDRFRSNPLGHYVVHRRDERRAGVLAFVDALFRLAEAGTRRVEPKNNGLI